MKNHSQYLNLRVSHPTTDISIESTNPYFAELHTKLFVRNTVLVSSISCHFPVNRALDGDNSGLVSIFVSDWACISVGSDIARRNWKKMRNIFEKFFFDLKLRN